MMSRRAILAAIGLGVCGIALNIGTGASAATKSAPDTIVYIGTQEDSIMGARLNARDGTLSLIGPVAKVERPTWLALDPKRPILYSVSELGNYDGQTGNVLSLSIDRQSGMLTELSKVSSAGGGPTYLSYDPRVSSLFVANFGTGHVSAIPVGADGRLSTATSVLRQVGSGPHPKQKSAHAHATILDPSGRFLLVPDMGADKLFVYRYDAKAGALSPADPPFEFTGPGTGPRHLTFSPDGKYLFLLTEHTAEIHSFRWDAAAGRLHPLQSLALDGPDFRGEPSAAEITISKDGRFLYASNRIADLIQVYAVDRKTGRIRQVQTISSGGQRPRSFGIDPSGRWMIVGNQISQTLQLFRIDTAKGTLAPVGKPIPTPQKPVAFTFFQP